MTTFPTLDPELAAALTMVPKLDFADLPNARATYDALVGTMLADLSFDGVTLRELSAPGLDGDPEVTIRFFTPDNTAGPVPVLLWIHGGGFAIGTAESSDLFCVEVARELGFAVANVEYRLAPETPFPGPVNDCYAALLYIHAHAEKLGVDPSRIAVGGQSAGGGTGRRHCPQSPRRGGCARGIPIPRHPCTRRPSGDGLDDELRRHPLVAPPQRHPVVEVLSRRVVFRSRTS